MISSFHTFLEWGVGESERNLILSLPPFGFCLRRVWLSSSQTLPQTSESSAVPPPKVYSYHFRVFSPPNSPQGSRQYIPRASGRTDLPKQKIGRATRSSYCICEFRQTRVSLAIRTSKNAEDL